MTENPQDPRLEDTRTPGEPAHAAEEPAEVPESEPVEVNLQPRPEPVLDAARLAGLIAAVVVAVLGLVALVVAGNVLGNLDALSNAISAAVVAVSALSAYVLPVWQARKARDRVTPLADPRDYKGRKLIAIPLPQAKDR
jgi:hypothetical protein